MKTLTDWRDAYTGAVWPLYGTPRRPDRQTLGAGAFEVSTRMGKPYRAWQRYVADGALEVDGDTGRFAYDTVVVIAMRQQGKSELILPIISHRAIAVPAFHQRYRGAKVLDPMIDGQQILYTAQTADAARLRWRRNHLVRMVRAPGIKQHMENPADEYGGAQLSKQSEAMFFANGSQYSPGATTGKTAGTGDTLDMALVDEAWSHQTARAALGMRPAMLTRDLRQLWSMSMIPGPTRLEGKAWAYLKDLRDVGRARVRAGVTSGMFYVEYAADDEAYEDGRLDPFDPRTWAGCMPNLGHGISPDAVAADAGGGMGLADFLAEYLGIADKSRTTRWHLIKEATWGALHDPMSEMEGRPGIGVEISEDRRRAWVSAAGRRADGHWHLELIEPGNLIPLDRTDVDWVERVVEDVSRAQHAYGVAVDGRRQAGSLRSMKAQLEKRRTKFLTPTAGDWAAACGRFYDATGQEVNSKTDVGVRVYHLDQAELNDSVAAADRLDLGGGAFTFVKRGSPFGLGALYSGIGAMLAYDIAGPVGGRKRKPFVG